MSRILPVSLVSTVYNEASNIERFLDSVKSQTRLPGELIIVDGGSTDATFEILKNYRTMNNELNILLLRSAEKINIAKGRNIAIQAARNEIIAVTDAGCSLDETWLNNIVEPIRNNEEIDVVGGWYEPWVETPFEKKVADAICLPVEDIDPETFLPSSRSIAFRKRCWKAVNGYPEWLTLSAEDTLFDLDLKRAGCRFYFCKNAIVKWKPRGNWKSLAWIHYSMGRGEGEARINSPVYLAKVACILFPFLFIITRKKFKLFSMRYVLYGASVAGWLHGLARGLFFITPNKDK